MVKLIKRLLCRLDYHNFSNWERAEFTYTLEGKSKPFKHEGPVRDCNHCKLIDEKPDSGVWQ